MPLGMEYVGIFEHIFSDMHGIDANHEMTRRATSQIKSRRLQWLGLDVLREAVLYPHSTDQQIAKALGCSLRTVRKYRKFADKVAVPFYHGDGTRTARVCVMVKLKGAGA